MQTILALETSCDESAVAVVQSDKGVISLLASEIASQVDEHSTWGGVVPEIASRMHLEAIPHLLRKALEVSRFRIENLDAIAATVTPGLAGSLLMGSITARTLAALYKLPFLGVHHLEGHLASVELSSPPPIPPYLVLLVSGGHTELIHVDNNRQYYRLARSHDDAAGEAFDKVARLLGLPYPGGPAIEKIAADGDAHSFSFPKGRVSNPKGGFYPYDFSFSGLKTSVLRKVEALKLTNKENFPLKDIAASFERAVVEVLVERSLRCAIDFGLNKIVVVGGVAANKRLRKAMKDSGIRNDIEIYFSPREFCTDNAAMIGAAGLIRLESGDTASSGLIGVSARWPLADAGSLYLKEPPF